MAGGDGARQQLQHHSRRRKRPEQGPRAGAPLRRRIQETTPHVGRADAADIARQDAERIKSLQAKIDAVITASAILNEYRSQIRMDVTPDGLQIQIVDEQNRPMFDSGSALVKPYMRDILRGIGTALAGVENSVSLSGHTDAVPYGNSERGYSNWELSADRANASRRELVAMPACPTPSSHASSDWRPAICWTPKTRARTCQSAHHHHRTFTREARNDCWEKTFPPACGTIAGRKNETAPDGESR